MSDALAELKATLAASLHEALAELDPERLVQCALGPVPDVRRVRVIAAGKAACAMSAGALSRWAARIDDALVVTVETTALASPSPRVTLHHAAHPVPDARSVAAADEALRRASELGEDDLLLALVSGGASALLAGPPEGMPLARKRALIAELLDRGAPIREVNLVRRHLSRIKGGRLAAAAAPARVRTLIVSDVIGGAPHDIASGPTVPDPSTVAEARETLQRYAPDHADLPWLGESLKPDTPIALSSGSEPAATRFEAHILADPSALARATARALERAGLSVTIEGPEEGEAHAVASRRVARAATLMPGEAVVIACEPTLALPATHGRGGRAGFIALAAMRQLPDDVALMCAASDGVDGSSGSAGAVVTRDDARRLDDVALDDALRRFDDASAHRAMGTHLRGGASGHNLADVHVIARALGSLA